MGLLQTKSSRGQRTPANTLRMFGGTPKSNSFSFGASAPSSSGFSFAGNNANTSLATTTSTANTPTTGFGQPSSGFGFGGNTTTSTPSTVAGNSSFNFGFGGNNSSATSGASTGTTQSFGSTPGFGTAGTTSSFGSTPGFGTAGSSGFGGANTASSSLGGNTGFGFGSKTGGTGFGTNTSSFGAPTGGALATTTGFGNASTGTSLFGQSGSPSSFGTTAPANTGSEQVDSPLESLNAIKMAYQDPQQSRFKHMFYNLVEKNQRHLYKRPPCVSERLWKQAETDNPNPEQCVPAVVLGFEQLEQKIKAQQNHADVLSDNVQKLRDVTHILEKNSRSKDLRLQQYRAEHTKLFHKLIEVMRKVEVLQCLRKPLHHDEVSLRNALQTIQDQLNRPTKFKARLNSLVALQQAQSIPVQMCNNSLSATDMATIHQALQNQRQGLKHLTDVLKKDLRDIEIMNKN